MGDEVEKTCPLCAEEMDLTDQQLKPCKCGYEICVWCWHHIMDMAERENTEGRCPACRKPYDKEKIVGMTANCERLVAEINSEKKLKSQKLKSKTHEGRKHLSSVRVIQRNLVYVIGIPSNLADEDFLQRKEYFGQYGKVLKVAISRTAGGTIQHSSNNTCSVYITYSKEEEAVRCIQSIHDYILEGQSLRACFGTTKYCHAWLRNTPCTNPDCLYLHDIGTPEDSFTKDDIVSAYTRSRIPQINGAANNLHRQSGNVLPPPVDDICNSGTSSGKPTVRSAFNNVVNQEKGLSPHGNSRRSITLPAGASWGLCATNGRPPTAPPACSDEPAKQNPDALSEQTDVVHPNGGLGVPEQYSDGDGCTIMVNESKDVVQDAASSTVNVVNQLSGLPASEDIDDGIKFLSKPTNSIEIDRQSHNSTSEKNGVVLMNGNIQNLCTGLSSLHMDSHVFVPSNANDCNDPTINHYLSGSPRNQVLEQSHPQCASEPLSSLERKTTALDDACISRESPDWVLEPQMQGSKGEMGEDFLTLGERNLKVSEISHDPLHLSQTSNSFWMGNHSGGFSLQYNNAYALSNPGCHDLLLADREIDGPLLPFTSSNSLLTYGDGENKISNHSELDKISEHFNAFSRVEKDKCLGKLNEDSAAFEGHTGTDMGESTIISNILSLDFDSWDESLASPHNLAKILSENDRKHGSLKLSGSWKVQNSDQSRFSFARQENFVNQGNDFNLSSNVGIMNKYHSHQDYVQNGDVVFNNPQNGFFPNISEGYDIFPSSNSVFSCNKLCVSRGQISAPPGFSVPVRAPPPGFLATERMDESFSVNQLLERSLFRNQYQMQLNGDQDAGNDVELIDPAILAVGRGRVLSEMNNSSFDMRSTFNSQLSASENERRLQLLMQQSISGQQNHRYFKNIGDMFSPLTDPYNADSRFMEQSPFAQLSLQSRNLHTSNGWDGCHEIQRGNNLVMAELLRNEGFALNKNFPGYEGLKFQMSGSGSLYNREFGM